MIAENLFDVVLKQPAIYGATTLCIVSGYAAPGMAWDHWQDHLLGQVRIRLLVGMPPDGDERRLTAFLTERREFQQLAGYSELPEFEGTFECRYVVSQPWLHSKLYVWLGDNAVPAWAYVGSPNYTQSGFRSTARGEIVASDLAEDCYDYFLLHWSRGLDCQDPTLEDRLRQISRR